MSHHNLPRHQWRQKWLYNNCHISILHPTGLHHSHRLASTTQDDDVIKWKHFPRYWPFVWGIHRSPVNSPHKSQWRGALMFSLVCAWINDCVSNREADGLRRHRAHYDVIVMSYVYPTILLHQGCATLIYIEIHHQRLCGLHTNYRVAWALWHLKITGRSTVYSTAWSGKGNIKGGITEHQ